MAWLLARWGALKPEVRWSLGLWMVTRPILVCIGVASRILFFPFYQKPSVWIFSSHRWLDLWGVWDTGWYLNIATHGYSALQSSWPGSLGQANYAFFPLYPYLMKALGWVIGSPFIAGILISNVCLILSGVFLYRLIRLNPHSDEAEGLRAIKYLFLFPTAFIFSSVFTESLFLLLLILSFYFARQRRWWFMGMVGFFLALTRSLGVVAFLPLLYEYLKSIHFTWRKIRLNILALFLLPCGLGIFAYMNLHLTGDAFAFVHIQAAWGRHLMNPVGVLWHNMFSRDIVALFSVDLTILAIIALCLFFKRLGFSYWFMGLYSIFIPLASGWQSLPRYLLVIFPLFLLQAFLTKHERTDQLLTIVLALTQGFLMVFWSLGFPLII